MKCKVLLWIICLFYLANECIAQYEFTPVTELNCTGIKNQQNTGTCWSFATCSFLESELMRMGKGDLDLSEMFIVRNIYRDKALNYVMRQGKANFSEGGLSHDFVRSIMRHGIVPEEVYAGRESSNQKHDHAELSAVLKGMLDAVMTQKKLSDKWDEAVEAVMDVYLGSGDESFTIENKTHTPKSYAASLGLDLSQYISLTSFTHHPYYSSFILEIPDNFSNQSYYNIPLSEMESVVDEALENGFSVAWDGDVSEKGFSSKKGLAIMPVRSSDDIFDTPQKEKNVSPELRQSAFESYSTTDDHLMHIVGIVRDQNGHKFYKVKNSWGPIGEYKGYLYMSMAYFNLKTVAVMVNKDALPASVKSKILG